jgi:hypothetical protein
VQTWNGFTSTTVPGPFYLGADTSDDLHYIGLQDYIRPDVQSPEVLGTGATCQFEPQNYRYRDPHWVGLTHYRYRGVRLATLTVGGQTLGIGQELDPAEANAVNSSLPELSPADKTGHSYYHRLTFNGRHHHVQLMDIDRWPF